MLREDLDVAIGSRPMSFGLAGRMFALLSVMEWTPSQSSTCSRTWHTLGASTVLLQMLETSRGRSSIGDLVVHAEQLIFDRISTQFGQRELSRRPAAARV